MMWRRKDTVLKFQNLWLSRRTNRSMEFLLRTFDFLVNDQDQLSKLVHLCPKSCPWVNKTIIYIRDLQITVSKQVLVSQLTAVNNLKIKIIYPFCMTYLFNFYKVNLNKYFYYSSIKMTIKKIHQTKYLNVSVLFQATFVKILPLFIIFIGISIKLKCHYTCFNPQI